MPRVVAAAMYYLWRIYKGFAVPYYYDTYGKESTGQKAWAHDKAAHRTGWLPWLPNLLQRNPSVTAGIAQLAQLGI